MPRFEVEREKVPAAQVAVADIDILNAIPISYNEAGVTYDSALYCYDNYRIGTSPKGQTNISLPAHEVHVPSLAPGVSV